MAEQIEPLDVLEDVVRTTVVKLRELAAQVRAEPVDPERLAHKIDEWAVTTEETLDAILLEIRAPDRLPGGNPARITFSASADLSAENPE